MSNNFDELKRRCLGKDDHPNMKDSYDKRGPGKVVVNFKKGGGVRSHHDIGGNVAPNNIDPTNANTQSSGQQPSTQAPQQPNAQQPTVNTNQNSNGTNNMSYNIPLKKGGQTRDRRAIGGVGKVRKDQY